MLAGARKLAEASGEDCLYLNVWTPSTQGRRPVLVWVYGGGFETGSASPPKFDGATLSRLTGAVVVAANYRLGALGWLCPPEPDRERWADSANLGLQDQVAALHWVSGNIAAFGGDPDSVTLAGTSAGAFAVGTLLTLPAAAGTFHRAILHSGSTSRVYSAETAAAVSRDLFTALGVDDMRGFAAAPLYDILRLQSSVTDPDLGTRNLPGGRAWGMVLDGTVLAQNPHEAVKSGAAAHVPLLIGANEDEFRMFAALLGESYVPDHEGDLLAEMASAGITRPAELLAGYRSRLPGGGDAALGRQELGELRTHFLSDAVYRAPAVRLAHAQTAAGGRAYTYLFTGRPMGPEDGSYHSAESMYLFDKLGRLGIDNPEHREIRDTLVDSWARFMESGDPGWPAYDPRLTAPARRVGTGSSFVTEPPVDVAAPWAPWTHNA
jgi:para-nitrobenzyl esterase